MKLASRVRGLLEMMNEADRASEAHIHWDNYAKLPGWNVSVPLFDGSISTGGSISLYFSDEIHSKSY